jgi:hypothetical protein
VNRRYRLWYGIAFVLGVVFGGGSDWIIMRPRQRIPSSSGASDYRFIANIGKFDAFAIPGNNVLLARVDDSFCATLPNVSDDHVSVGPLVDDLFHRSRRAEDGVVITSARALKQGGANGDLIWDTDGDGRFDRLDREGVTYDIIADRLVARNPARARN